MFAIPAKKNDQSLRRRYSPLPLGVSVPRETGELKGVGAALRRGGGYSSGNLPLVIFNSYSFPDMMLEMTTMSPTFTSPSSLTSPRMPPVPPMLISFIATSESLKPSFLA